MGENLDMIVGELRAEVRSLKKQTTRIEEKVDNLVEAVAQGRGFRKGISTRVRMWLTGAVFAGFLMTVEWGHKLADALRTIFGGSGK